MKQDFNKPVGQAVQADTAEISSQQFHGPVNHVAAGDIINNNAAPPPSRELTGPEKNVLKRLVASLENEFAQHGGKIWNDLHEALGTGSLSTMQQEHFRPAKAFLELMVENAELRAAGGDAGHLVEEVQNLRQQQHDSAVAMTKLTERNAKLGADLRQAQDAHTLSESRYAKALQQLELLRGQSQSLNRIAAERDQAVGSARDLQQQAGQLEAHLQRASRRLVAMRRKLTISLFGVGAAAIACAYLGFRLHAVESLASRTIQQSANAAARPDANDRTHTAAVAGAHRAIPVRHHVTTHHSSMRLLPALPGQLPPMSEMPNSTVNQAPVNPDSQGSE